MTSRATKAFMTGAKFIGGGMTPAYTLEFLTPTTKYPQGAFETIVLPYIEIGREGCQINFGVDSLTVSRKHAAIERKNKETIIRNLSKTNPTLVNGRPVIGHFYLNNGDEIQFSLEGPRIRYNEYKTGTTRLALTKRMQLIASQTAMPYKRMLIIIGIIMFVISVLGAILIYNLKKDNKYLLQKEVPSIQYAHCGTDFFWNCNFNAVSENNGSLLKLI